MSFASARRLATLFITLTVIGSGTTPAEANNAALSVGVATLRDCIDCAFVTEEDPPQVPGHPYIFEIGQYDCEDGYSPNGPCVPCGDNLQSGFDCEDEGYYAMDISDFCEEHACSPTLPLINLASKLLSERNFGHFAVLMTDNPKSLQVSFPEGRVDFIGCTGTAVHSIRLTREASAALQHGQGK